MKTIGRFIVALLVTGMVFLLIGAILNPLFGLNVAVPIAMGAWVAVAYKFERLALSGR